MDLNFMYRVPLWPVTTIDSHPVGTWRATGVSVLDPHELAAGKLMALLGRRHARDVFDSHRILRMDNFDSHLLRIGFVVYGAMNRKDWRTVSADDVDFDVMELTGKLVPMLRVNAAEGKAKPADYKERLLRECREGLSAVPPFTDPEREFLDSLLDRGVIDPTLLTADESLQRRIQSQPLLKWKALNVRRWRGLS